MILPTFGGLGRAYFVATETPAPRKPQAPRPQALKPLKPKPRKPMNTKPSKAQQSGLDLTDDGHAQRRHANVRAMPAVA